MKLTLAWLRDHLDTAAPLAEIADALTDLGLEVEGVEDPAGALDAFTLARVRDARPHPDADKLRVLTVETDEGERQVVCGAPNARAGLLGVLAKPGTYVPGIDTTISVGRIRGVESQGMMCSEREMRLSDEHDGIIELFDGEVGQRFSDWLRLHRPEAADPVIEIKVTPNRPDALGVRGIARDLAARGLGTLRPLPPVQVEARFESPVAVRIEDGSPFFALRVLRGVRNGPSPAWLQARLRAVGLRPISALVDVTNLLTHDLNRPLHVFDAAKLKGGLVVRPAREGESLEALDGKTYDLPEGTVVIADDAAVVSLAGIMGGAATGVTEETTDVVVESALWDPRRVAATGRRLKVHSDARHRFERGVDPLFAVEGLDRAVALMGELCGGAASGLATAGAVPDPSRAYRFDPARLRGLVGLDLPEPRQRAILGALGFRVEGEEAWVPSWRPDVLGEADLVEEVARVASLSGLAGVPLPPPEGAGAAPPPPSRLALARAAAAAAGYSECVTYAFIDRPAAALFGGGDEARRLENPIAADLSDLRPSLLPGLLRAAARNQARGAGDLQLFEASEVFTGGEPGEQRAEVAGVLLGRAALRSPHGPARPWDAFDAKADLEAVLAALGAPARAQLRRDGPPWWHPGRHGVLALGPAVLGIFGELHPRTLRALDVRGPALAWVLWPDAVPARRPDAVPARRARPPLDASPFQAVERDLAFVVDARVEAQVLLRAAEGADRALIASVRLFDAFQGGALPPGTKSLALTVRLQPRGATLTEAEIERVAALVVDKVSKATGATLRA